jgi:hypothetical protein
MDSAQRGVMAGMVPAVLTTAGVLTAAVIFAGPAIASRASLELRVELLAASVMAPAISLLICIARLANHRFFTAEDINGSALTEGTARAKLLQALLQNTLEQSVLAALVYVSCSFVVPGYFLGVIPAAASMFLVGRVAFFAGYADGAPARAFGFALTFYPTVFLAGAAVFFLVTRGGA